jgi:hypothetical protein
MSEIGNEEAFFHTIFHRTQSRLLLEASISTLYL